MSRDMDFQRAKHKLTDNARDAPSQGRSSSFNQGRIDSRERSEAQPRTGQKQTSVNNSNLQTDTTNTDLRTNTSQADNSADYEAESLPSVNEPRKNSDFFRPQMSRTRTQEPEQRHTVLQRGNRYQQRFRETAQTESAPQSSSKLRFTDDEVTPEIAKSRQLEKAQERVARFEERLHKAEGRQPSRRRLKVDTLSDSETGKTKKRLRFEKEIKSQSVHLNGPAALRPVKGAANLAGGFVHNHIYQTEHEHVGIQAAHRTELVTESGLRRLNRFRKVSPYRRVERLQKRTTAAQAKAAYQKLLADNPEIKKKGLAKLWYKKKLKRKYAKAAREAQKAGKRVKNTAVTTEKIAAKVVNAVRHHPVACLVIALLLLLIFFIMSVFSSCGNMGASGAGVINASSYQADDNTITQAELTYTEWETDLQMEINSVENDNPGYDEYRYQIGAIEHDPYVLMGYLTAVYGEFDSATAEAAMQQLFNSQYNLTLTEQIERRTRTEQRRNPDTGQQEPTEVEYEYKILNVTLSSAPLESVVASRVNDEQKGITELLMTTKGSRQYVKNVFGSVNWLPSVTSYFGYRVHPISGEKNYHTGVDIGMAQGTEILAGHDGTVTTAGESGGYGLCVVIEGTTSDGKSLVTKYGHCSQILVSNGDTVRAGDVIAKVGSTGNSTGPHLHLEVLVDGEYLNPLYFAETGDDSERTLPDAASVSRGNYLNYSVPPEALSDSRFRAILTEAEKYLGYPYVWGGSDPSTSFDCSGFVSWVINHSGWDVGRQGVLGLEDYCTTIAPSEAKPGDLIFFERTYDVVGASHVGIYVGDGMMIHCGDPISYANINTSYWQEHFLHFGRLP